MADSGENVPGNVECGLTATCAPAQVGSAELSCWVLPNDHVLTSTLAPSNAASAGKPGHFTPLCSQE